MIKGQKKLGELFIDKGLITPAQLDAAIEEQKKTKEFLGIILVRQNQLKERDLLIALAEQFAIPFTSLKNRYIDWKLVGNFSSSLILHHKCFPIQKDRFSLTVAIVDPLDVWALKKAEEEALGLSVKPALVSERDMEGAILRYKQYLRNNLSKKFE